METDIGNPIDYKPEMNILSNDDDEIRRPLPDDNYYYEQPPQQPMMYMPQHHPQMYMDQPKTDFFSSLDKNIVIVAFVVFLLGFFMGKTMQPVILRYT